MTQLNTNIDSLLDGTLDDLADMPEFKPFPAGAHTATVKFEQKEISNKPAVEVSFTAVETNELANPEDTPAAPGDTTNIVCFLDNELGQGQFKAIIKSLRDASGDFTSSNREVMEASQGITALIVTKVRQNKEKTQSYTQLVSLTPL